MFHSELVRGLRVFARWLIMGTCVYGCVRAYGYVRERVCVCVHGCVCVSMCVGMCVCVCMCVRARQIEGFISDD